MFIKMYSFKKKKFVNFRFCCGKFVEEIKYVVSAWRHSVGKTDSAYCFIQPGDRAVSEAEGIITVFRPRS